MQITARQEVATQTRPDTTNRPQPKPQQTPTVGQPTTNEQASKEVTKQKEDLTPQFTALARQQKALRDQQKSYEAMKRDVESQKAALALERKEIEDARAWKQRLHQDPYGVMLESGLPADQVGALLLNQPNPTDQKTSLLERKIAALESAQTSSQDTFKKLQDEQYTAAKKQIRNDVIVMADGNDQFKLLNKMKVYDEVVDLIDDIYRQEGIVISNEEAAAEVEKELRAEARLMADLLAEDTKVEPQPQASAPVAPQTQKQQVTLSNRMVPSASKPMTSRERRERAILAFQGKLS